MRPGRWERQNQFQRCRPWSAVRPWHRGDGRVDADQLPRTVNQRAAGVSRVDGRIGLDGAHQGGGGGLVTGNGFSAVALSTARSDFGSRPTNSTTELWPSLKRTSMVPAVAAAAITWLLVRMHTSFLTITALPTPGSVATADGNGDDAGQHTLGDFRGITAARGKGSRAHQKRGDPPASQSCHQGQDRYTGNDGRERQAPEPGGALSRAHGILRLGQVPRRWKPHAAAPCNKKIV